MSIPFLVRLGDYVTMTLEHWQLSIILTVFMSVTAIKDAVTHAFMARFGAYL